MEKVDNNGCYTTMITPYNSDGSVDYETVRKLVHFYYDGGCDGIFAVCQSSEIFFLTKEERTKINKIVYEEAERIASEGGRRMTVVSSGHVSNSLDEQIKELQAVYESGTDALILITNRLAKECEGDDVFIENAEKIIAALPSDVKLGFYECPYPYKRLLTPKLLEWCVATGRFKFIKDTCCDSEVIKARLRILDGSGIMLFNANAQTLLTTLRYGAAGYCGIMANYHPEIYSWLTANFEKYPTLADSVQEFCCMSAFTECGLPYPLSAKYHMSLVGRETELITRKPNGGAVTEYVRECMAQMKSMSDKLYAQLKKEGAL